MAKLVEIVVCGRRSAALWDDGRRLFVRADGRWQIRIGTSFESLDALFADYSTAPIKSSGTPENSSVYLTLDEQEMRNFLMREMRS